jgi:hypothetical protein
MPEVQGEGRQQRSLLGRAVVDQPAVAHHLERSEDGDLHGWSMAPGEPVRQALRE